MKTAKAKRPKVSLLHDEIPKHFREIMQLARLAEVARLAANVAHELNNPLMVIQGFAENIELLSAEKEVNHEEIRLETAQIIKACQRMSRIISKMSRMSRSQKLRLHVLDLAEISLSAVEFMQSQLTNSHIQVEFDFNNPLPIKCDGVQIEQMILNILSNAVTALDEKTTDRRIRINFEQFGDWNQAKIWNNGPPIPESVQAGLMAPFFSTKTLGESEGAGMALAVSKAIMQVHGGDLSFRSEPDFGTEFVLSFPKPIENPWKQKERRFPGRVIVIDPQEHYRRSLEQKLRLLGFETRSHEEYQSALQAIRSEPNVTGVFVEIGPGVHEGRSFVRELRRILGPTVLIFATSSFPSAQDLKSDLKAAGASEFFEKPIHADHFEFILQQLDSASAAASAAADKPAI